MAENLHTTYLQIFKTVFPLIYHPHKHSTAQAWGNQISTGLYDENGNNNAPLWVFRKALELHKPGRRLRAFKKALLMIPALKAMQKIRRYNPSITRYMALHPNLTAKACLGKGCALDLCGVLMSPGLIISVCRMIKAESSRRVLPVAEC